MSETLPLSGLRVADFARVVAGPYSTYLLARLGADVLKVEGLNPLDSTREVGPYSDETNDRNRSGYFGAVNAGKRSITLDLRDGKQASLARAVASSRDIVVQSFLPGTMERFGLDFETLSAINPNLVMVSCSGFGGSGPMSGLSAYMNTIAAYVGLTSLNSGDGFPTPVGATFSDLVAGTTIAFAAMLGVRQARETGRGVHIDLSMAETSMALMGEPFMQHFTGTPDAEPMHAPRGVYRTRGDDKWIAISVRTDAQWANLARAMGTPEWAVAQGYRTVFGRLSHRDAIDRGLGAWVREFDNIELAERLQSQGVPAVPASDPEDVVRNRHFLARGSMAPQDNPAEPGHLMPNLPWRFTRHPGLSESLPPPPLLGEHNREILGGIAEEDLLERIVEAAAAVAKRLPPPSPA